MLTLIIFLLVLGLLIMVQELGHFLTAKRAGIRVDEFGFGFPPKLWSKKYGETTYSINAIPFGGFVKILGENADELLSPVDQARALTAKPKLVQAWVLFAGVFFNFLLAWFLLSTSLLFGLPVESSSAEKFFGEVKDRQLIVTSVLKNYPAGDAGLLPGDQIVGIKAGGQEIVPQTSAEATAFIRTQIGREITFNLKRPSAKTKIVEDRQISVMPKIENGKALVGVGIEGIGLVRSAWYRAPYDGLKLTVYLTIETSKGLKQFFGQIFSSGREAFNTVAGPVGLFGLVGDASKMGLVYLLSFIAILSINLAIINLLPFPALDGGRLFFLAIEAVKGSPLPPKMTAIANVLGFFFLIGLMLIVSFFDVLKLF